MLLGNLVIISAVALMANSFHFFVSVVSLYSFIYHVIVLKEERDLHEAYGRNYEQYTQRVNRWIPDLRRFGHLIGSGKFIGNDIS